VVYLPCNVLKLQTILKFRDALNGPILHLLMCKFFLNLLLTDDYHFGFGLVCLWSDYCSRMLLFASVSGKMGGEVSSL
jgi:hypothetical protein